MMGKTISHYRILEKLGEGGMGVVYKAQDTKLDRFVALKFLPPHLSQAEEEKKRFIREAKAASALNHPNIATIYEIDEAPALIDPTTNRESRGQMFIAMEYIEGRNLKSIIDTRLSPPSRGELKGGVGRPLPIDDALNYATQIAEGLSKAHEKGVIHRDIKPANIMITNREEVKIVDFGLAKLAGRTVLTKDGTTLGTVAYMSPEQTQGTDIDHRADIWALGAVVYEMITGRQPFAGGYEQAVMYSIMNEDPEPITGLRTGVPMELERIVNKALTKKPEERYQHVDEMQTDLRNLSKQFAPASGAHPPKFVDEKDTKKRLKIVAIPVGILLMLVLGFFLMRPLLFEEVLISEPKPIAVISFENQTGDKAYDYLQKAIPNLLITSLEQSKYLRVTTWERMNDLLKQMGKNDVEIIDKNLGFELCRLDGINTIVIGSFVKAGNIFATDVKMLDVTTKRIIKSTSSKGKGVGSILDRQIDELSKNISRGVGLSKRRIEATQMRIADVTTTSMDAYNSFLKGRESLEKYYYDNARQLLEQAVQLDSTFAVAQFYLAWVYGGLGNLKAMVATYEKAKTLAKKATEKERLYIDYAYAYAVERNQEKQFRILKRLIKEYPKEKRAHYYLGILNKGHKFYDKAIEEFNKALELDPDFGPAMNDLAYTYADMGDFEKAIEYFKKYASVSPGDANPFDSMAELYFRMGRLDEALTKYKEAIEVKPDFFDSYWRIGYIYALKEDYPEAMKWIDKFLVIAPSPGIRAHGYAWKGFYRFWLGNLDLSLNELRKLAELTKEAGVDIGRPEADWMKGWIFYERGELELGRKVYNTYLEVRLDISFENASYYLADYDFYLGLVDLKYGRIDSAKSRLTDMKSLLPKINPGDKDRIISYSKLLHAEILLSEAALQEAIDVCEKASPVQIPLMYSTSMLRYNIPFLKDVLARTYLQNGEPNKAITEYEQLTTFDPKSQVRHLINPKYHYRLAKLYQEKGWPGKAIEQYEKFLGIWKNADEDWPELIDAKARLTGLQQTTKK